MFAERHGRPPGHERQVVPGAYSAGEADPGAVLDDVERDGAVGIVQARFGIEEQSWAR